MECRLKSLFEAGHAGILILKRAKVLNALQRSYSPRDALVVRNQAQNPS